LAPLPNRNQKGYDIIFNKNRKSFNQKFDSNEDSEGAQEANINSRKNNIFHLVINQPTEEIEPKMDEIQDEPIYSYRPDSDLLNINRSKFTKPLKQQVMNMDQVN
jgi:hypothetical protein